MGNHVHEGLCQNQPMTAFLRLFWNICLLRDGPEAVPTQTWFLSTLIAAELAISVIVFRVVWPEVSSWLGFNWALIGLAVTASIAWFALYLRDQEARFPATLGAVLGTKVLIGAVGSLILATTSGAVEQGVGWVLTLWGVVVVGFILHRALATRLWTGILLSLVIVAIGYVVAAGVLGGAINADVGSG